MAKRGKKAGLVQRMMRNVAARGTPEMQKTLKRMARKTPSEESQALTVLRTAPSPMFRLKDLRKQRCVSCGGTDLSVCRYPAYKSSFFAGLILAQCRTCGLAWVPVPDLDLDTYYTRHYADEFRSERAYEGAFYADGNPLWSKPTHKVRDRSRQHAADLARFGPFGRVLDLGAGEGMFLNEIQAEEKYAVELDAYSVRILTEELGVTVQNLGDRADFFDLVMASHSLEHFTYQNIEDILRGVFRALKPGGLFHIEVPPGAVQLMRFNRGNRPPTQRLEPHTLFYSSHALDRLLRDAGFELVESKVCTWTAKNVPPAEIDTVLGDAVRREDRPLIVIARRPA